VVFTNKLLCSPVCAASMAVPASASALDSTQTYDASIATTASFAVGLLVSERDGSNSGRRDAR
jgi:hypothetical protein